MAGVNDRGGCPASGGGEPGAIRDTHALVVPHWSGPGVEAGDRRRLKAAAGGPTQRPWDGRQTSRREG